MAELNEHLAPLGFLVGKTWKGEFAESTPEKPLVDVMRWERALNGNAIRILHSVNDGDYGGETLVVWDREAGEVAYFYFTTSGFYTRGRMAVGDGRYTSHEDVSGSSTGISAVKAHLHVTGDGHVRVESQYFKEGAWVEGHEITYAEDSSANVRYR